MKKNSSSFYLFNSKYAVPTIIFQKEFLFIFYTHIFNANCIQSSWKNAFNVYCIYLQKNTVIVKNIMYGFRSERNKKQTKKENFMFQYSSTTDILFDRAINIYQLQWVVSFEMDFLINGRNISENSNIRRLMISRLNQSYAYILVFFVNHALIKVYQL